MCECGSAGPLKDGGKTRTRAEAGARLGLGQRLGTVNVNV